jgi:hypothetical protein
MNRTANALLVVAVVGLLLAVLGAPARPVAAGSGDYFNNFEENLKPWVAGAGSTLVLQRGDSACPSIGVGAAHVGSKLSWATVPPEMHWMEASFPNSGAGTLAVTFAAKSDATCGAGCTPVIYVGDRPVASAGAFASTFGTAVSVGWSYYNHSAKLARSDSDRVYVALGVTAGPSAGIIKPVLGMSFDCLSVKMQDKNPIGQ